jgi:hypothetical protein
MDIALGVLLFVSSAIVATVPTPSLESPHIRTDDPYVRVAIDAGVSGSPLFHALVDQIDSSDLIVYVSSDCGMPSFLFGKTVFMSAGGGRRYVMIRIACARTDRERVAILGHELQHAIEIADAPSVVDQESLAAEYRRIGFMSDGFRAGSGFDTHAAIETGRRVWAELGRSAE